MADSFHLLENSSGGIMAARILLVDDNKDRRESVLVILKSSGYQVIEAADFEHAFSLLVSERFDLILLDITLPDKSGFKVLEFLKENHLAGKVIVITGAVGIEYTIKSATPGARDYITKPYDPERLLKSIEHVLSDRSQTNLKLQIIKAGDFIKSTPTGDLDMEASTKGLAEIAATGTDLQDYTVLIDLRDVKSRLSTAEIHELATRLVNYGVTFRRKTAVLVRADEDIDQAMFFENVAQNRGFSVKTFTVFEDAIIWLSTFAPPIEDKSHGHSTSDHR
jgi:DNA-binding response OmpR family regulator